MISVNQGIGTSIPEYWIMFLIEGRGPLNGGAVGEGGGRWGRNI